MPNKRRHHSSGHHSVLAPVRKSQKKITAFIPEKMEEDKMQATTSQQPLEEKTNKVLEMEEKINKILEMVQTLPAIQTELKAISSELKEHQTAIEWSHKEIEDLKQKVQEEEIVQKTLQNGISQVQEKTMNNTSEIEQLRRRINSLEAYSRRDNLLFLNIPEETEENCREKISKIIEDKLKVTDVKLSRIHRLGAYKEGVTRAIIARFHFFPKREEVWRKRYLLKGTSLVIKEDFPEDIHNARQSLTPVYNHIKFLGAKARLIQDTIVIDGRKYRLNNLPKHLSPRNIFSTGGNIFYSRVKTVLIATSTRLASL